MSGDIRFGNYHNGNSELKVVKFGAELKPDIAPGSDHPIRSNRVVNWKVKHSDNRAQNGTSAGGELT